MNSTEKGAPHLSSPSYASGTGAKEAAPQGKQKAARRNCWSLWDQPIHGPPARDDMLQTGMEHIPHKHKGVQAVKKSKIFTKTARRSATNPRCISMPYKGNAYCKIPLLAYFLFNCSRIYSGSALGNVSLLSSNWSCLSSQAARTVLLPGLRWSTTALCQHLLLLQGTCKGCWSLC